MSPVHHLGALFLQRLGARLDLGRFFGLLEKDLKLLLLYGQRLLLTFELCFLTVAHLFQKTRDLFQLFRVAQSRPPRNSGIGPQLLRTTALLVFFAAAAGARVVAPHLTCMVRRFPLFVLVETGPPFQIVEHVLYKAISWVALQCCKGRLLPMRETSSDPIKIDVLLIDKIVRIGILYLVDNLLRI